MPSRTALLERKSSLEFVTCLAIDDAHAVAALFLGTGGDEGRHRRGLEALVHVVHVDG